MKTQVAAQMYTVREFMKTPADMDVSLGKVKASGYDAVQLSGGGPIDPADMRALLDKHELTVAATHIQFDKIVHDTEGAICDHRILGCEYIGLGGMPAEYRNSAEGYREFARVIEPAARKIADAGLTFIYHNHNFEFARFDGKTGLQILMESTDPAWMQFEIDTYWVQMGGGDPIDWIRRMAGRMDVVHFKDMATDPAERKPIMAEVGEGNLNWQGIIAACAQIGVKWHIVEQDICQRDPFESLEISLRNLHRLGLR